MPLHTSDPLSSGPTTAKILLENWEELNTPKVAKLLKLIGESENIVGSFALDDLGSLTRTEIFISIDGGKEFPLCVLSEKGVTKKLLSQVIIWIERYG